MLEVEKQNNKPKSGFSGECSDLEYEAVQKGRFRAHYDKQGKQLCSGNVAKACWPGGDY